MYTTIEMSGWTGDMITRKPVNRKCGRCRKKLDDVGEAGKIGSIKVENDTVSLKWTWFCADCFRHIALAMIDQEAVAREAFKALRGNKVKVEGKIHTRPPSARQ